jgi:hypothetical protein
MLLAAFALQGPARAGEPQPATVMDPPPAPGWRLPPIGKVTRRGPPLVNYHHMSLPDGRADHKEERLAQWDVVVLNHDLVAAEHLSIRKMRETNPRVRVLAWVPLQGPNEGLSPGVPPKGPDDWFLRQANGEYLVPHWGGNLMNPYVRGYAWARHVLEYVEGVCLKGGLYDGVMLDCMWERPWGGMDVNRDGRADVADAATWQEATAWLACTLRERHPTAAITGNSGLPWPAGCPYFKYANGNMHENALGDQFGRPDWEATWQGCQAGLASAVARPPMHLIIADVRMRRSQDQAQRLAALTGDDLRRMRLGLGAALLADGAYFGFDRGDCLHGQLWWFDEYDADLGNPLGQFRRDAYGPGTFARGFERGIVIVNPTGTEVKAGLPRSARDVTTRKVGRSVTVPPSDARIVVWQETAPAAR